MESNDDRVSGLTRRDFLAQVATGAAATALLGADLATSAHAQGTAVRNAGDVIVAEPAPTSLSTASARSIVSSRPSSPSSTRWA
jgi:hypothetical protein